MSDGCLQVITEPIPAVRMIEQQHHHGIYQMTFANSVIAAFVGWDDCRNDRMKSICFGNNEVMDVNVLSSIADFSELLYNICMPFFVFSYSSLPLTLWRY